MGNQQPNDSELALLARNALLGDGYLWKHPECKNYKAIWTSTEPELLELKRSLCPDIFTTGVRTATVGAGNGRFPNAKPLYRLATRVHPLFTQYKHLQREQVYGQLTMRDLALWYLDDGCAVLRKDCQSVAYRYTISVGSSASTPELRAALEASLRRLVGDAYGRIYKNNGKATNMNQVWIMPANVAMQVLAAARPWGVLLRKFPS